MKALEELKGIEMMGRLLRANLVDKSDKNGKDDKKGKSAAAAAPNNNKEVRKEKKAEAQEDVQTTEVKVEN